MSSANQEVEVQTEAQEVINETTTLASEVAELKLANEKLEAALADLTKATEAEILAVKEEAAKKMDEEKKKKEEEMMKMKAELDSANETLAAYKAKEADMLKKEKLMKRKASLVEQGIDSETADSVVEKFESIEDDAFEAMTTVKAQKWHEWREQSYLRELEL